MKKEESLHKAVCNYIRMQYPDVIFNSDLSGIKLTIGQATKLKSLRSSRAFPDIVIYEPRGGYCGLFIELKADGTKIFKKNGEFTSEHIKEQWEMLKKLASKKYFGYMCTGFDSAKEAIDNYLMQKP